MSKTWLIVFFVGTAVSVLLSCLAAGLSSTCPAGWVGSDQACYKFFKEPKLNYFEARRKCQCLGSYLATPNSEEENTFIAALFNAETPEVNLWLGCEHKSQLVNSSDDILNIYKCHGDDPHDPSPYRNVHLNPTEKGGPLPGCVMLVRNDASDRWRPKGCSALRHTMCERNIDNQASCFKPFHAECSSVFTDETVHNNNTCLIDHTYQTTPKSPVRCCLACIMDSNCLSFNMISGKICQLNNLTVTQAKKQGFIGEKENCVVYEKD